jgi:CO/xanthine dehydrogenase FAD-binding subunit
MRQLKAYHRPKTINEALELLARPTARSIIVAGGTYIVPRIGDITNEVVDLQEMGLTSITADALNMEIGAMVTLQMLVDHPKTPAILRDAAHREGPNTFRNAGTVGGAMVAPNKESEFVAALLVSGAQVTIQTLNGAKSLTLSEMLKDIPSALAGGIITAVTVEIGGQAAADRVARTPADSPIVAAVARQGQDGVLRLALCGVANTPVLVDPRSDIKAAVNPKADFRGSTEYRRQLAATLSRRVLNAVNQ